MKYWKAHCPSCGEVKIKQKTKPTTCKEQMRTGPRSIRRCGSDLRGLQDITAQVLNALDKPAAEQAVSSELEQLPPHELTLEQFSAQAIVTKLVNHGRKWDVALPGRYCCFSDAETDKEALLDAHRAAVNNALYFNTPDAPDFDPKPSIPPAAVLALYPDVVARFPELSLGTGFTKSRAVQPKGTVQQLSLSL